MGNGASTGKARHYYTLFLFFRIMRKYSKVRKREQKLVASKDDLTFEELEKLWKPGQSALKDIDPPELPPWFDQSVLDMYDPVHEEGAQTFLDFALKQKALWYVVFFTPLHTDCLCTDYRDSPPALFIVFFAFPFPALEK